MAFSTPKSIKNLAIATLLLIATCTTIASAFFSASSLNNSALAYRASGRIGALESAIAYRASGRVSSGLESAIAYRASGRLESGLEHRGTGRLAYRGSERGILV